MCNFKQLLVLYTYCDKIQKILRTCAYINMKKVIYGLERLDCLKRKRP